MQPVGLPSASVPKRPNNIAPRGGGGPDTAPCLQRDKTVVGWTACSEGASLPRGLSEERESVCERTTASTTKN